LNDPKERGSEKTLKDRVFILAKLEKFNILLFNMRPHSSPKFKKRQLILSHIGNTRSEHLWEQREQEKEEDTRHDCNVEPKSSIKITPGATVWNADCEEIAPLLNRRYNDHFWICSCQVCIRS
jgi:hypothetical protein